MRVWAVKTQKHNSHLTALVLYSWNYLYTPQVVSLENQIVIRIIMNIVVLFFFKLQIVYIHLLIKLQCELFQHLFSYFEKPRVEKKNLDCWNLLLSLG